MQWRYVVSLVVLILLQAFYIDSVNKARLGMKDKVKIPECRRVRLTFEILYCGSMLLLLYVISTIFIYFSTMLVRHINLSFFNPIFSSPKSFRVLFK
jgi:hypothetical protein